MCLQTSQQGSRAAWMNRELLMQLRGKRRVYDPWKKGQTYQREYNDAVRSYTDKIRKAKVQLERYVAINEKDNKMCFYSYIKNKRCFYKHIKNKTRAKENLHSLLDIVWYIVTKDEEEGEVFNVFFVSVFNRKTGYPQLLDPGNRDREQNPGGSRQ